MTNEHASHDSSAKDLEEHKEEEQNIVVPLFLLCGLAIAIAAAELSAKDYNEFIRLQSKAVYVFFLILLGRIVLFPRWYTYYKRVVNYALGKHRSVLPLASLLNVVLDVSVILLMLFWVEVDKVHFVSVPVVPIVYIVLAAVQLVWILGSDYWSAMRQ